MPPTSSSNAVHGMTLDVLPRGEDTGVNEVYVFHRSEIPVVNIGRRSSHARDDGLGSAERGMVELRCPVVSRAHACLMYSGEDVLVEDRNSHHGTFLRKQGQGPPFKLAPDSPVIVDAGDVLTFGKAVGSGNTIVHPISVRVGILSEGSQRTTSQQVRAPKTRGHFSTDFNLSDSDSSTSSSESEPEQQPFAPAPSKSAAPSFLSFLPQKRATSPWRLESLLRPSSAGTSTSIPGLGALPPFRDLLCSTPVTQPGCRGSTTDLLASLSFDSDEAGRSENSFVDGEDGDQSSDMDIESETGRDPAIHDADSVNPSDDERPYTPGAPDGRISPGLTSSSPPPGAFTSLRDDDVTFDSDAMDKISRMEVPSTGMFWTEDLDAAWTPQSFAPSFQCGTCIQPQEYCKEDTPRIASTSDVPNMTSVHAPLPAVPVPALSSHMWEASSVKVSVPDQSAVQDVLSPPPEASMTDQQSKLVSENTGVDITTRIIEKLESSARKTKDGMWHHTSSMELLEEKLGRASTQLGDVQAVLDGHTHELDLIRVDNDNLAQHLMGMKPKSDEAHSQICALVERVAACESTVEKAKAEMSNAAVTYGTLSDSLRDDILQIRRLVEELREAQMTGAQAYLTMDHDSPRMDSDGDIVPSAPVTPTVTGIADPVEAIRAAQMEALAAISAASAAMCTFEPRAEGSLKRKRALSEDKDDESDVEATAFSEAGRSAKRARSHAVSASGMLGNVAAAAAGAVAAVILLSQI